MAYIPLQIPPGVFRNGTAYQAKGRWYDSNLVRWRDGQMMPVGGWQRLTSTAETNRICGLFAWRDNSQRRFLAIGTSSKLKIFDNDKFYDITPTSFTLGRDNSLYGLGYGASKYGQEAYGTERSTTGFILEAASWSMDNWGEDLVAVAPHDGKIYEWATDSVDTDPVVVATQVANSPTQCRALIVTEERHLVAFGADGNVRKVAWSDQEDNTTWTPSATNAAGDYELVTSGQIMGARRLPGQIIIWTDVDAHVMRYVGPPFVYGFERVGTGCGIANISAHMGFGNAVAWMGDKGFFVFDGVVRPLQCEVSDYVFSDINMLQSAKITAGHIAELGEIWWFYPSGSSLENDRYVIWNYRENHWAIGQIPRTSWIDSGVFTYPLASSPDGHIYQHEDGYTNNGVSRIGQVYAKSAPIEIGTGEQLMAVRQLLPDGCPNVPTCTEVSFEVQQTPQGPATTYGPYNFTRSDGYADARFTGRQVEMTVAATQNAPFRFGTMRLDAVTGSRR